jgi:prepilin signal peptidase PulO-like enzyme (type II secretory pathway)
LILGGIFGLIYRAKRLPFAPFMAAGLFIANLAQGRAFI